MTRLIKRPVFIFHGDSCACKSYLAAKTGLKVFEVDSVTELPDEIKQEVVVLGNKNKHISVGDVKKRIYNKQNVEVIVVGFNREGE